MKNPAKDSLIDVLFLLGASLFFLIFRLGYGSLASWDEAIYASVAKEMALSGDWLRLTLNGAPWFDKPPVSIWGTAVFYKLFGVNEFSARLFSALCGVGAVLVTYFLGRRLFNRWTGFVGALVLLSSSHFLRFARFGMTDAPLVFFLTLALFFFWRGRDQNRYLIFSGIALGLGILTKSFAALMLLPVVWLYCLWAGEMEILGRSSYWIGVILAVAIALPWNLWETFVYHNSFVSEAVVKHSWVRTLTAVDGHGGNFYFYIRVLVNKYHPWVLIGIFSAPLFLFKALKNREPEIIFLTSWMFVIFIIITVMRTKLPWYLLPVYPPLSLSVACFFVKLFHERYRRGVSLAFLLILVLHIYYSRLFSQDYSHDLKILTPAVQKELAGEKDVYLYNFHESPAISFYWGKRSLYVDNPEAFVSAARSVKNFFCVVRARDWETLQKDLPKSDFSVRASVGDLRLLSRA